MFIKKYVDQSTFRRSVKRTNSHRWHQNTDVEAYAFLLKRCIEISAQNKNFPICVLSSASDDDQNFLKLLRSNKIECEVYNLKDLPKVVKNSRKYCLIVSLFFSEKNVMEIAQKLNTNGSLAVPFEYALVPEKNYQTVRKFDQSYYHRDYFIAPFLTDEIDVQKIYEDSLKKFEQKCDIRDYLDLYQSIRQIVVNQIPGDIVEFGSYKGHSGYLISELLKALKSNKKVWMYDTFESFPIEQNGIDVFWTNTHQVEFEDIKKKFRNQKNCKLIKGDFTKTFLRQRPNKIALAYVDCDSYRATEFIIDRAYRFIQKGGVMVFEDYGHPALLGNRLSIKGKLRSKKGVYCFYSQYSGLYTVVKMKD